MRFDAQMKEMWDQVKLPVFVLKSTEEGFCPIYQNRAADVFCPDGTMIPDILEEQERKKLFDAAVRPGDEEQPVFCQVCGAVYSAVLFEWQSFCVCMLHKVDSYYQETQKKLNEAVMASRAKTSFLSEMSHDIRTPMNAIIGMTDIALMQKEIPAQIQSCLTKIRTASGHMMSLLNEVLDMSRIESGKILLQTTEAEIADILHEILIVAKPQADAKQQKFTLTLGRMDQERIVVDPVRLKQICINLLSNAVKFTPEGGSVSMFLAIEEDGSRADQVVLRLTVKDTGIGMSREFLSRVFVPFEREESALTSKIQGTGLGMAITKNLVELMGGSIWVESSPGEGTEFDLEIPFQKAESDEDICRNVLCGRRILFLDGQQEEAEQVIRMAEKLGMEVDWARRAEQAVHFINDGIFSGAEYFALLVAEQVQDVEILSFLPEIRKRMGADFPILMLSESDWKHSEYMFTRAGVDAFIPLPLFYSRFSRGLYAFTQEGKNEKAVNAESIRRDFSGRRLLLVEDNELNREIAEELLGMSEILIETAENGREALEKFSSKKPFYYDLILMDIQMPVMNGSEATRAIRALDRPDAGTVPIIAMTANAFVEDVRNSLEAGMDAHVSKPLDMDLLLACMERLLTS